MRWSRLSRARPLLASVGCPDEWPSNSPGKYLSSFLLLAFYFTTDGGWRVGGSVAIIPSPSVNRLSYFPQFLYTLSRERRVCWTSKRFAFFLSVNWVLFFAGPHRSFFPLQLSFYFPFIFYFYNVERWNIRSGGSLSTSSPAVSFFLTFRRGVKRIWN